MVCRMQARPIGPAGEMQTQFKGNWVCNWLQTQLLCISAIRVCWVSSWPGPAYQWVGVGGGTSSSTSGGNVSLGALTCACVWSFAMVAQLSNAC